MSWDTAVAPEVARISCGSAIRLYGAYRPVPRSRENPGLLTSWLTWVQSAAASLGCRRRCAPEYTNAMLPRGANSSMSLTRALRTGPTVPGIWVENTAASRVRPHSTGST